MQRNQSPGIGGSYVSYVATDHLFRECALQADYSVPEAFEPRAAIPTDEHGTHIGIGRGWWYESTCAPPPPPGGSLASAETRGRGSTAPCADACAQRSACSPASGCGRA